ncbi:hypothetical protein [Bacillus sp. USDA818B3_A]|uniref:hypothetical protein n=1 Tax=Bacillus sp. USDA818B3_A TaxID=2698834 RepID=UPI00136ED917|nr:hypothetical protein [Bacillus sp. USDA818B3_A]
MTRLEYVEYINQNNIDISKLNIVIGARRVVPYITGCFEENGIWKLYLVGERQDFDIVQEGTEDEIFDVIYNITVSRMKTSLL